MNLYKRIRSTKFANWLIKTFDLRKPVITRTPNQAIFHCCVQKTGSSWVTQVFKDRELYRYHGLKPVMYNDSPSSIPNADVPETYRNKLHLHYYIDFPTYQEMEKPKKYKTIYIYRDPRDIVVSWYFSMKDSHLPRKSIYKHRETLNELSQEDGLTYAIKYLNTYGLFFAMSSWIGAEKKDENVLPYRYEDLIDDNYRGFGQLFKHCDIDVPEDVLKRVVGRYKFSKQTDGRPAGVEDTSSHLRKGVAGDWVNYFEDKHVNLLNELSQNLTTKLGYA